MVVLLDSTTTTTTTTATTTITTTTHHLVVVEGKVVVVQIDGWIRVERGQALCATISRCFLWYKRSWGGGVQKVVAREGGRGGSIYFTTVRM